MSSKGTPIKLLHEITGFQIEVQLKSGDRYRGTLSSIEDNMNLYLTDANHLSSSGQQSSSETVFVRGSNILYMSIPQMFSNAISLKDDNNDNKGVIKRKIKRTYATVKTRKDTN